MPRQSPTDKAEKLRLLIQQKQAELDAIEAKNREAARKADMRRKIIAGALALEHRSKNPDDQFTTKLNALLEEYVIRAADRALFDLAPLEPKEAKAAE